MKSFEEIEKSIEHFLNFDDQSKFRVHDVLIQIDEDRYIPRQIEVESKL